MVTGCYWDDKPGKRVWEDSMQRIVNPPSRSGGTFYSLWDDLRIYPALLLLYGGGVSAVAAGNYSRLVPLLAQTRRRELNWEGPMILRTNAQQFLVRHSSFRQLMTRLERACYPVSEHLHETLRKSLREYLPDDEDYSGAFARFEYLLALVYADLEDKRGDETFLGPGLWGPIGRFGYRLGYAEHRGALHRLKEEAERDRDDWAPLRADLFDGSFDRFQTVMEGFDEFMRSVRL